MFQYKNNLDNDNSKLLLKVGACSSESFHRFCKNNKKMKDFCWDGRANKEKIVATGELLRSKIFIASHIEFSIKNVRDKCFYHCFILNVQKKKFIQFVFVFWCIYYTLLLWCYIGAIRNIILKLTELLDKVYWDLQLATFFYAVDLNVIFYKYAV